MFTPYLTLLSIPGARKFAAWGLLARVQMGMTGLATFMLVQMEYGSYEAAGIVLAAVAISYALLCPLVARVVDTYGQSRVLGIGYAIAITGRMAMIVAALTGAPLWMLVAIAPFFAAAGTQSTLTRARWTHVVRDRAQLNSAFSLESSMEGLLFIAGPIMATLLAAQVGSWVPSVIAAVTLAVGGYMFLSLTDTEPPVSRRTVDAGITQAALGLSPTTATAGIALPPITAASARRRLTYRNPFAGHLLIGAPTLALVMGIFMTQGLLFASVDASTVAFADEAGHKSMAGLVLGLWSFGSLIGGFVYGSRVWHRSLASRLFIGISYIGVGASTFMFSPSIVMLGALMFLTGLALAPTMVIADSLVHATISRSRVTEGMTWTRAGMDFGIAFGAWFTGSQIDRHGSQGGFAVTMIAGLLGILFVASAWRFIRRQSHLEEPRAITRDTEIVPGDAVMTPAEVADSVELPTTTLELPTVSFTEKTPPGVPILRPQDMLTELLPIVVAARRRRLPQVKRRSARIDG